MKALLVRFGAACPCGSGRTYRSCCFRWEAGGFLLALLGLLVPVPWGARILAAAVFVVVIGYGVRRWRARSKTTRT
jgi:uncharacterized protein YchJ